jgi:hypothetical protein
MADSKLTELTENTSPALEDLLYSVDDPGGSPVERKITIENILKLHTPNTFVDRGGLSSPDYSIGDLTTDGTWRDLDLSSIVPAGATHIELTVQIWDESTDVRIRFRENGISGEYNVAEVRTHTAWITSNGRFLVKCDSNRVIEYFATNTTISGIYISVTGWITNVNDSVLGFSDKLIDRGDPSDWDFEETDLTTDATWRDLDCSSIVPAGVTHIAFRGYINGSTNNYFQIRKNGNSNAYTAQTITCQRTGAIEFSWIVPCDTSRIVEYLASNVSWTGIKIVITGWIIDSADISFDYAPNELINGEFALWQEASSIDSTTTPANNDDTYICDQWILLSDGNDVVDVSRGSTSPPTGSKYFLHSEVETINKKFGFFQPIENLDSLKYTGEKASLSFQVKGTLDNCRAAIISWDGTADTITSDIVSAWNAEGTDPTLVTNWTYENTPSNIALTTSWVEHKIENVSIDTSGMTNIGIFIWADDTDGALSETLEIGKVKLELNSVCTKFIPLPFFEEVKKCQRFFEKSYNLETDPGSSSAWSNSWQVQAYSATMVGFHIQYEVRKRNTAAVVVYSPSTGDSGKVYDGAGDENSDDVDEGESGFLVRNDGTVTSFISCHWTANSRL